MKGKTKRRAPVVVAFVAALGVALTASPALARTAAWCPEQARATCERPKPDKPPVKAPKQARPKAQPAQVKDVYGNTAFRSGSWTIS
jgi:hypothetical protein